MKDWFLDLIEQRSSKRRCRLIAMAFRGDALQIAMAMQRLELMGWIEPIEYDDDERCVQIKMIRSRWTSMRDKALILTRDRPFA